MAKVIEHTHGAITYGTPDTEVKAPAKAKDGKRRNARKRERVRQNARELAHKVTP